MKQARWIVLAALLVLYGCRANNIPVTIFADGQIYKLSASQRTPAELLAEAGLTLGENDRLLYLGTPVQLNTDLPPVNSYTLTVRRAVTLTVVAPDGTQTIQSSANTVGQALAEAGFTLYAADRLDPPAGTPLDEPLTVTYQPSRELTVTVDGTSLQVRSAAPTVGEALAEAGIPLVGLDYSTPSADQALPADGQVRVVRVVETVALTQQAIPFDTRTELSANLELDQQALLQGGEPGLAVARQRTRSEDGQQVSQTTEAASIVRPPQDRILGIGTKIVIRTATVDGVTIEYWRTLNLYATYYIPCDPATKICHYGTSSGKPVQKGVVAMVYPWYLLLGGQPLYIPGYGFASVEDNNGAYTTIYGTHWIDLGYSQTDDVDWTNHDVTIYFLTPVPANVADTYLLP